MARLGSSKRPAVVRVNSFERAEDIVNLCDRHGVKVIVGVEPEKPEDVSDLRRVFKGSLALQLMARDA